VAQAPQWEASPGAYRGSKNSFSGRKRPNSFTSGRHKEALSVILMNLGNQLITGRIRPCPPAERKTGTDPNQLI
jgi:hypothetical protein